MTSQVAITLLKSLEQSLDSYCELNDEGKTAFSMAISALELFGNSEQLPSAQPRKGKWLKAYGDHEAFGVRPFYYYCSECNKLTFFPYDFCPSCGADMREGDAE